MELVLPNESRQTLQCRRTSGRPRAKLGSWSWYKNRYRIINKLKNLKVVKSKNNDGEVHDDSKDGVNVNSGSKGCVCDGVDGGVSGVGGSGRVELL